MNSTKILAAIFSSIVFCLFSFQNISAQDDRALIKRATNITNDSFTIVTETPKGARIYAVNEPNAEVLKAIDKGLTNLFVVARKYKYRKRLEYSDYTIFIAKPDRTTDSYKNYSPDIAVGAAQYAGTVFDKGGYIYAAGMVLSNNPCAFVFAEHTKNFERISEVVRYEGEHLVLYHNDRRLYNETADHSRGGGHPILK